jgi:hypothetical protein
MFSSWDDRAAAAQARRIDTEPLSLSARLPPRPIQPLPFELAALSPFIDSALLEAAARRAETLDVGGDEVVRAHCLLAPDRVIEALAARLGLEIDRLDDDRPPDAEHVLETVKTGAMSRNDREGRQWATVVPRGKSIARLGAALRASPRLMRSLRIASPERLANYMRRVGATELARVAALGLYRQRPDLSAGSGAPLGLKTLAFVLAGAVVAAGAYFPNPTILAAEIVLAGVFIAWTILRVATCLFRPRTHLPLDVAERGLPVYTIVVPLYREARVVPKLIAALQRLDYPPEKLDIKLITEADDPDTRHTLACLRLHAPFEELVAPFVGPRTKPKALAAALPFARGTFVVVYDAEDEPDSDQLRRAFAAFRIGPPNLACVQAQLAIDNVQDSWLTRIYAAEYASLFDVLLPALARMRLPLPLGGTSNHFRTDILRRIGGWDPFNVTEDADLGIRLARFGYLVDTVVSTTREEAPAGFGSWLRQRTRWLKGWIQTYLVHMRAPRRLASELGLSGFLTFQLLVGGNVLSALVHPFFLAAVAVDAANGTLLQLDGTMAGMRNGLELVTLAIGYFGSVLLGAVGLGRRRMLGVASALLATPIYWLLLSLAAWRALGQFLFSPYKWEKTEHGLARTSWRNEYRARAEPPDAAAAVRAVQRPRRKIAATASTRPPPHRRLDR